MIAILHNIRSLHNVGSIFRTADGAGVKKIYLTGITPSPRDKFGKPIPQMAKVSLGAENFVEWEKLKDIGKLIVKLKYEKYKIIALEQSSRSVDYRKFKINSRKIVLIAGNEVKGLAPTILKKCDAIMEIPMRGKKESLNVSVAFGIAAYQLSRTSS